jgi:hypothetical protein
MQYASGQCDGPEDRVLLTAEDEEFRRRIRGWLEQNLTGRFAELRGLGGPGREHERLASVTPSAVLDGDEFNEVFFDGARTSRDMVVGGVGQG